jgi:hypothetical protein
MRTLVASLLAVCMAAGAASAQQERRGASFPTVADLKSKVGFDDEQGGKAEPICTEYAAKIKEAMAKVKDAEDKRAAFGEVRTLSQEGMGKLKELCKDDDQKKKFEEAFPARRPRKDQQ